MERIDHLFLDVLNQERRGTQVVYWEAEEALDLLLMQVHGDNMCYPFGVKYRLIAGSSPPHLTQVHSQL